MALQDTIVVYKSAGDCYLGGVLVPRNAAQLYEDLASGSTSWKLELFDDTYLDCPFSVDDIVWIGKEKIKVAAGSRESDHYLSDIVRAQESTDAANHNKESLVFPKTYGTLVLDETVLAADNGKVITAFRGQGGAPAQWEIFVNDVLIAPPIHTLYHQEMFFPWSGSQISTDDTIKIRVLSWYPEAVFWAQVIG